MKKKDAIEVLEAKDSTRGTRVSASSKKATAIVPYRSNVPALVPSLGNLDAYIHAANMAPVLSAEEEHSLAVRLRDENDLVAAQQLVVSHLRLVVSIARGYLGYGLPHADLIQEGNIGLMKAIKHYDPDRGVRLMTFAVHWIRSEIQEYIIRNWRLVKVATTKNQRKLFFNLRQMKNPDEAMNAERAQSIASTLDVKPEEVLEMDQRMSGNDTPLEGTSDAKDDASPLAPIDYLTNEEDTPETHLEEKSESERKREGLKAALSSLDPRSRRVIEARWLMETSDGESSPLTLQELALELGVSAERVRQIEKEAIATLREAMLKS